MLGSFAGEPSEIEMPRVRRRRFVTASATTVTA